jgi:uracil-DNA glycosylase
MNWELFKECFHESWHAKMQPFIESEECDKIYQFLKSESKRGKKIAPLSSDVYKCFKLTPLTDLKVVLMGMCPYHTLKNNVPVADGLLMGCSSTGVLQPSLQQFYDGVEKELYDGLNLKLIKNPDVSYLANQGVLMFNAALTVEVNKAGSHNEIWAPFIKYVMEDIIAYAGVPVVFLGKDAAKYERYTNPFIYHFTLSHPAHAARTMSEWDTKGTFGKINRILKENNNLKINWMESHPPF